MATPEPSAAASTDPVVVLADALNQVAMVVEEIAAHASQSGYLDTTNGRRRRWRETLVTQRERIAELIPS